MHPISCLSSLQFLAVSLLSISALTNAYAIPSRSEYAKLDPRGDTVDVAGKVAEIGQLISHPSHEKSQVSRVEKWDGNANPGYVIKTYMDPHRLVGEKEVEGLKAVGQYIGTSSNGKSVVMKEVKGKTFAKMVADQPRAERPEYIKKWKPKIAEAAASIAIQHGILHNDIHVDNVIVHDGKHIQFVDWENHLKATDPGFTTDKKAIEKGMWTIDSGTTTPRHAKSNRSPVTSGMKSAKRPASPSKKVPSPASLKRSKSLGASGTRSARPHTPPGKKAPSPSGLKRSKSLGASGTRSARPHTPPRRKVPSPRSKSPGPSGKNSARPHTPPGKKAPSSTSIKKPGSRKRKTLRRRAVF